MLVSSIYIFNFLPCGAHIKTVGISLLAASSSFTGVKDVPVHSWVIGDPRCNLSSHAASYLHIHLFQDHGSTDHGVPSHVQLMKQIIAKLNHTHENTQCVCKTRTTVLPAACIAMDPLVRSVSGACQSWTAAAAGAALCCGGSTVAASSTTMCIVSGGCCMACTSSGASL